MDFIRWIKVMLDDQLFSGIGKIKGKCEIPLKEGPVLILYQTREVLIVMQTQRRTE